MKPGIVLPGVVAATLLVIFGARAQEEGDKPELTPEQVSTGEVHVTMNSDYARVRVDGAAWEEHAFEDNGKTLVIHRMDRTDEHQVTLTPVYPELAPVEFTLRPADWKLVKLEKRVKMWRAKKKVVFSKATKAKKARPAKK
ncbi:MAG: hypothetical protein ISR64_07195 [Deltaproteobacteria bacterium]|nr:hypothetical protein [Deltaproteobacteria bacterium]